MTPLTLFSGTLNAPRAGGSSPAGCNAGRGSQGNLGVEIRRQAHTMFLLHKILKHVRLKPHPRAETEPWAGSSTEVRNPLPNICWANAAAARVPIRLGRLGLTEPRCEGFAFIPSAFLDVRLRSTWLNSRGLERRVQKYKHFARCSLPVDTTMTPGFFSSVQCLCVQQSSTCYDRSPEPIK